MDTIVTLEGRRQIANAQLKIEYVSFTDAGTYYRADIASGSADATARIYFEQSHLPQDQITLEANDAGRLGSFQNSNGISVKDGQILEYSLGYSYTALSTEVVTGSSQNVSILSGEQFNSTAATLLASSIDNFTKLQMIGTKDPIFEDDGFEMGNKQVEFVIHNDRPLPDATTHITHLSSLESLFQDVRLSKVRNFKYLPPINKLDDQSIDKRDHRLTWQSHLGFYKPWGRTHTQGLTPWQLEHELEHYGRMGYARTINFDPTSLKNNLIGQFFEVNFNVMKKLDVIDYGLYTWQGRRKHAFFAGKVLTDDNGTNTFVHLFTLVFG